jgi:hypothetical protein
MTETFDRAVIENAFHKAAERYNALPSGRLSELYIAAESLTLNYSIEGMSGTVRIKNMLLCYEGGSQPDDILEPNAESEIFGVFEPLVKEEFAAVGCPYTFESLSIPGSYFSWGTIG